MNTFIQIQYEECQVTLDKKTDLIFIFETFFYKFILGK